MNKFELTAYLCLAGGMLIWLLLIVTGQHSPITFLLPLFGATGAICAAADRRIWLALINGLMMISPLLLQLIGELLRS